MNNNEIKIINKNSIKLRHKCDHEPYEYNKYKVTEEAEENKCHVSIYEILPKKANYPYHYHLESEEVFYIISGNGILETPNGNKEISAGDVIVCPASEKAAHRIINSSDSEILTYFECDTVADTDVVYYPNSDKVGILARGGANKFYKSSGSVDYYEGE